MNLINDQEEQVAERKSLRNEEIQQTCILNDH